MRSKSLLAALALAGLWSGIGFAPVVHAADAKSKAAAEKSKAAADKKKAAELHADEKSMKKQLQWEDKVLGPDDKRAELDKIARAHAINEKAEKEKERQAALEAAAPAPAKPAKKDMKAEVALPSAPEEKSTAPQREVSPKLSTEAAMAAPAPVKPADDKFIDKLLKEEQPSTKKRASASDRELENLLAGAKGDKPSGRKNKGDSVDDLLKAADKGPAMPAPRAAAALPDWTKTPDIAPSAPPPPPPVAKAPAKKDDGVIQVVQGAASFAPPPPPPPVATRAPAGRKNGRAGSAPAKAAVEWNDPFADKKPATRDQFTPAASVTRKETAAARPSSSSSSSSTAAAGWSDPFADVQEVRRAPRRQAPPTPPAPAATAPAPSKRTEKPEPAAHPPGWKDPFTKAPAEPARAAVAMRELSKSESSKWEIASHSHRGASRTAAADTHAAAPAPTGWSILKKRAR
jgi:hypothetical protein